MTVGLALGDAVGPKLGDIVGEPLGERDGVQGTTIANCVRSAGGEVALEMTFCFV